MKNNQNRKIVDRTEIREGENGYYLSVPNHNDQANIKILPGSYNTEKYTNRIVAREEMDLYEKRDKIQQLFKSPSKECEVPKDEDATYWRVIVSRQPSLRTVKTIVSKSGEKVSNQKNNYLNNCFKFKKDAEERVKEIQAVLCIELE